MHRFFFAHSLAMLAVMALILLPGVVLYFLNKKNTGVSRDAEDADTDAFGSLIASTETRSGGSSSSPVSRDISTTSGSSTSSSNGNCYDVFLSFRGSDTREGFTDHLYNGLVGAGICTFRDSDDLCQGKEIGPNLLAAIKNSKMLIPIFSENYGSSKWCLDELVQMMKCKNNSMRHSVFPIFYKVAPTHVRHQIGSFGDAFRTRWRLSNPKILEKWKQALIEASFLKGWEVNG